jgi:hypothetical protein
MPRTRELSCESRGGDTSIRQMRVLAVLALMWLGGVSVAHAAEPAPLARARSLYNAGNFDGAIDAAAVARTLPGAADAAALVIARSHLERYRNRPDPGDLAAARETLAVVHAQNLSPRDQVDLFIGLGQSLYLGEVYGASAELFDTALTRGTLLSAADGRQLLDWWATALDREAQSRAPERRVQVFDRILTRMEDELRLDPANPVANYWLAVAARGIGDPERAWDAAVAAWVRSSLSPATAEALRGDLDRLVTQALITERARLRPTRDQQDATAALRAEWELLKSQWK